jgi:hypothetical protein
MPKNYIQTLQNILNSQQTKSHSANFLKNFGISIIGSLEEHSEQNTVFWKLNFLPPSNEEVGIKLRPTS